MAKKKFNKKIKDKGFDRKGSKTFLQDGNPEGGLNDIAWWNENPQLLKDAAALSYGNIAGLDVDFQVAGIAKDGVAASNSPKAIPGLMKLEFTPIIGVSADGNSPVNNASRLVYAFIRHANSGSRNYEQSDYFTYLLAVSNLLVAHAELVRLYGCAQVYSKMNRYVGKALIESMGYDFEDVTNNLASLRYGINALAVRINSFAIPKSMHIFARHISLATNIFKDSTESKAQLYYFQPRQYFKWSAKDNQGKPGSSLEPVMAPTYNTVCTVSDALNFVSSLIDALAINEDCGLMSGDTLKSFDDAGIYHVNAIPEGYMIDPVYDQVMLSQIHNAEVYDIGNAAVAGDKETMWITQNENNIIYNPRVKDGYGKSEEKEKEANSIQSLNVLLDSGMESPTPEFNMEATRLKAVLKRDATTGTYTFSSIGTEIINSVRIYTMQNGVLTQVGVLRTFVWDMFELTTILFKLPFDWAPLQYVINYQADTNQVEVTPAGELFNYTLIGKSYLDKVHNAALLSALNVYSLTMSK